MNGIQLSSFSYSFSLLFWSHFRRPTRAWFGPTNSLASTDWFVCMWHRRREKERLNDRKIERKTNRQRERGGGTDSNNANNSSSSHNSREICEKLTSSGLTSFFFPFISSVHLEVKNEFVGWFNRLSEPVLFVTVVFVYITKDTSDWLFASPFGNWRFFPTPLSPLASLDWWS